MTEGRFRSSATPTALSLAARGALALGTSSPSDARSDAIDGMLGGEALAAIYSHRGGAAPPPVQRENSKAKCCTEQKEGE